jgi:hypothetical protein
MNKKNIDYKKYGKNLLIFLCILVILSEDLVNK